MRRRIWHVTLGANYAYVRGYGTREQLTALKGGRLPVWSAQERAWVCQPKTARDLVALGENRGYELVVTGESTTDVASVEEGRLW